MPAAHTEHRAERGRELRLTHTQGGGNCRPWFQKLKESFRVWAAWLPVPVGLSILQTGFGEDDDDSEVERPVWTSPGSAEPPWGALSPPTRTEGLVPKVAQRTLYRERICRKSFGMSRSEGSAAEGFERGNCEMRSSRCAMLCRARLNG